MWEAFLSLGWKGYKLKILGRGLHLSSADVCGDWGAGRGSACI